jgi:hypothetical protein
MLADDFKVAPEVVVKGDAVAGDETAVEEVHDRKQECGLVGSFVGAGVVVTETRGRFVSLKRRSVQGTTRR